MEGGKSRSLYSSMCFQSVLTEGLAIRRLEWSFDDRKEDLTSRLAMFPKVGSFRKEWEAEIWPKDPGVVASTTADG